MRNTNKGITLIALVITIIVMLILVAVTITMAVNGGLFEYSGRAATQTNEAVKQEQTLASGRINVNNVWYDSIDDYIANTPSKIQGGEMPTKLTITGQNIVEGKITLEVGDSITLGAKLDKGEVTARDIEWNNSNNDAVKVENGVITALNSTKGSATITAKYSTLVDSIEITVNSKDCTNCTGGTITGYQCTKCSVISDGYTDGAGCGTKCITPGCQEYGVYCLCGFGGHSCCYSCGGMKEPPDPATLTEGMEYGYVVKLLVCGHSYLHTPVSEFEVSTDCPTCIEGKVTSIQS